MEDTHVVFECLNPILEKNDGLPPQAFFGVYDGHGGVEAASFAAMQLHHIVAAQATFADNVSLWGSLSPDVLALCVVPYRGHAYEAA